MSVPMQTPRTKRIIGRVALHTVGPAARLKETCAALASLGFTIVPAATTVLDLLGSLHARAPWAHGGSRQRITRREDQWAKRSYWSAL